MNIMQELKRQIPNIEEIHGDYLLPNKYMPHDPRKPKRTIMSEYVPTEEDKDFMKNYNLKVQKRRTRNFSEGINFIDNLQRIDIYLIEDAPSNWTYMPLPNETQLISLMDSIETIGQINPIILLKYPSYHKYAVLDGKSRVIANKNLYETDPQEKYRYPLCLVLDAEEVDEYYIRSLILDLNYPYRNIPQDVFIKMILERHTLLKKSKNYRKESNIAEQLADEFLMSTSSIYNYLVLEKLTEEVMTLLFEKRISLSIARLFARVDHDVQLMILQNIDYKDLNCYHKMKYIIGDGSSLKKPDIIKELVDKSRDLVPEEITFTVTINKKLLDKATENLVELKKYAVLNLTGSVDNANRFCKIRFDKKQMNYYLDQNLIDEERVNKLRTKKIREVFKK